MLHAIDKRQPNVQHVTHADDLLMGSDAFLVDGADLHQQAIRFAMLNPKRRANRPVMLLLNPTQVNEFENLARRAKNVDFIVKPVSEKALAARLERLLATSADHDLESRLRDAVARSSFELAYQPKVEIASGKCTGFEALLRWNDPQLGQVSPGDFIPLAENLGLINDITRWVVDAVCRQVAHWRDTHPQALKVSLNLSGQDLQSPDLADYIEECLGRYDLPASCIELEITESVLMENLDLSAGLLERLHDIGLSIALDDFGTGYSSLAYLDRMPIDTLKLDRSFIQQILNSWSSAAITSCVITLAQMLGLRVVAEGVETQAQFDTLKEHDCDEIQGRLFSMPLSAEEAEGWLEHS